MGRLLSGSSGDSETLSSILEEEILQVDKQLVDIQTSAEELSGTLAYHMSQHSVIPFHEGSAEKTDSRK